VVGLGFARGAELNEILLTAIALAVSAIPEGLPLAITVVLIVGMQGILKKGGYIRKLLAAETLGSTTYILTDKTGTLTRKSDGKQFIVVYAGKFDNEISHEIEDKGLKTRR